MATVLPPTYTGSVRGIHSGPPQGALCVYWRPNTPPCQTPAASINSNKKCCSLTWALRILCDPTESKKSERLLQMSGQSVCICWGFLKGFLWTFLLMSHVQTPKEAPPPEVLKAADNSPVFQRGCSLSSYVCSIRFICMMSFCSFGATTYSHQRGRQFFIVLHIRDMPVI